MVEDGDRVFHFEGFRFDPGRPNLSYRSKTLPLKRQSAEVLALLVKNAGSVVTREEIQQRIWPDRTIEFDHGINAAIRDIRKALGDNSKSPIYIGTQSKVGYKFLKSVSAQEPGFGLMNRRSLVWLFLLATAVALVAVFGFAGAPEARKAKVGIMPVAFDEREGVPLLEADKLTNNIVRAMAENQRELLVISAGELFGEDRPDPSIADMSKWFQVEYILAGSLEQVGGKQTLSLRLIRTEGYVHIWAKTIEVEGDYRTAILPLIEEITAAAR